MVALRKESVDRNDEDDPDNLWSEWSLSARRAWIEIGRNLPRCSDLCSRSPQGERG